MLEQVREIAQKILRLAARRPVQVFVHIKRGILIRFTNNGIHQNGFQDLVFYTLSLPTQKGPVYVESNDLSEQGIQRALAKRESGVGLPAKSYPQKFYPKIKEYFALDLGKTALMAARTIQEAVQLIHQKQASANGYYSAYQRFFYLTDSRGLEVYHRATAVRFGVTITKGAAKGYRSFYHPDPRRLKVTPVVQEAMQLSEMACRAEITLEPAVYECIFSPRAFLELIEPMRRHFDAQLTKDQKSVFSGRLGKKVFSSAFTFSDDISHPGQFGIPFDAEGAPKRKVPLIQRGVLKELLAEGHSTRGLLEHPFYPENLVVENGELSLMDLFKRVRRGVFINKIWYHTLVRESKMEVTGLATAGSLYIERGRVRGGVVHLRYHDSLFSILSSVMGTSKEQILLKDGERGAAFFPYLWVCRLRVV